MTALAKSGREKTIRVIMRKGYWQLYLLLALPITLLLIFKYLPMAGISIALFDYNIFQGFEGSPFVGLENFRTVLLDPNFWRVFRNTISINLLKLCFWIPLPLAMALMFNELAGGSYKKTVMTVAYFPRFLSWVIVGGMFLRLLSASDGIVNSVIRFLGFESINFMYDNRLFPWVIVISAMWKEVGFGTVVYMGVIAGIDPALYESAKIDGASRLRQIRHITIPEITGTIMVVLTLSLGNLLTNSFEQILIMYNPTVYEVGDMLSTYVYRVGVSNMQYGYATAADLFNSVIGFSLVMGTNQFSKRFLGRSLW